MPRVNNMEDLMEVFTERFSPEKAKGTSGVIQMNLSGENGGEYTLRIDDAKFSYEAGVVDDPDITVSSSFEDWMKVARGEANAMKMMMTGKIKIRGSVPLAMKFQSIFL